MKSDLDCAVESDVKYVETATSQDIDLRRIEASLDRPLVPFDDWTAHHKMEHRSMVLGNILAAAIIMLALIVVIAVLAR